MAKLSRAGGIGAAAKGGVGQQCRGVGQQQSRAGRAELTGLGEQKQQQKGVGGKAAADQHRPSRTDGIGAAKAAAERGGWGGGSSGAGQAEQG